MTVLSLKFEGRPVRPHELGVAAGVLAVLIAAAFSPENRTEAHGDDRGFFFLMRSTGRTCGVQSRRPDHLRTQKIKNKVIFSAQKSLIHTICAYPAVHFETLESAH